MTLNELKDTPIAECQLTVGELYEAIKQQLNEDAADDLAGSVMTNER